MTLCTAIECVLQMNLALHTLVYIIYIALVFVFVLGSTLYCKDFI